MQKILYFDPAEHMRLLVGEELTEAGYKVITHTGQGSLDKIMELIASEKPDLVLLEIKLENTDSLDLLQVIRATYHNLPIILYTAYDTFSEDIKSMAADFYVIKSFDLTELKQKISMAIGVSDEFDEIKELIKVRLIEMINFYLYGALNVRTSPMFSALIGNFKHKGYLDILSEEDIYSTCDELIDKFKGEIKRTHKNMVAELKTKINLINTDNEKEISKLYYDWGGFSVLLMHRFKQEINSVLSLNISGFIFSESFGDNKEKIIRAIEFPPEYLQSGLSILNYFSTVVKQKYPDNLVKITIEQEAQKVTMTIETPEGESEKIEECLEDYGLVVLGKKPVSDFLSDGFQIIELTNKLEIAKTELRLQHNLFLAEQSKSKTHERRLEVVERKQKDLETQLEERNKVLAQLFLEEKKTKSLQHRPETKELTILFIDLVGFSRMLKPERHKKVEILKILGSNLLKRSGGMYINTWGDAIVGGFVDPNEGLSCVCKFIEHLAVEGIEARIGMSQGTALIKYNSITERMDIEGESINVGARLEPIAESGEILVSKDLRFHPDIIKEKFIFIEQKRALKKEVGRKAAGEKIECYAVTLADD